MAYTREQMFLAERHKEDMTHCDMEPIHEIGYIQENGFLIAVRDCGNGELKVAAFSNNLLDQPWITETHPYKVFNRSVFELFDMVNAASVGSLVQKFKAMPVPEDGASFMPNRSFSMLHFTGEDDAKLSICCSIVGSNDPDVFLLEFEEVEPKLETTFGPNNCILQAGDMIGRIQSGNSPEEVTAIVLDDMMKILPDYDRGIVYRFHEDFSGEIIHENIRPTCPEASVKYFGVRFPAGDIPVTVRELYKKNCLRVVSDVDGKSSRIMNVDTEPLDLTMSHLRAVSNNHVHYLKTILGLRASMSMAIIVNDSLWGLYCLHSSNTPTKPSVEQRIMFEMVGSICSMRIDFFEREIAAKRRVDVAMVMRNIDTKENLPEFLNAHYKDVLAHLNAQAIVVYDGDTRLTFGDEFIVPTAEGYEALQRRCKVNSALSLSNFGPGLEGLGSGVIFYRHAHASIAIVRRAQVSDITWGQNPTKKFGSDNQMYSGGKVPYGKQYHPGLEKPVKEPFTVMVERNRAEVINWSELELDLATHFFDRTTQFLHEKMLETFRVRIDESNSTAVKAIETAQERYEFFAHMSHELRTPFHGIISSLQILKSGKIEEEERREIVDSALECGKSMTTTLNDILTIAKERTGTEAAHQPVLVHRVIKTTKRMMGPIAGNKGVDFDVEQGIYVHSEDKSSLSNWPVWEYLVLMTDTTRVGQVTNNLTGNAIKFTPPGGKVTINGYVASRGDMVQLWRKASSQYAAAHTPMFPDDPKLETFPLHNSEDPWYIFYVEDTGCGVTGEDIIVMFEAYKQVKAAKNTGAYQGTGLGLHICTTHAQQLGGLLAAASTQGKGTLFFFAVPVSLMADKASDEDKKAARDAAKTEKDEAVLKPEELEYINGNNASFLIVDDSKINIRLTKRKIQLQLTEKIPVDHALDGLEGIEYYKKALEAKTTDKITGIFMDYHMPNCSGVECILEIRRLEKLYNVPPVYIIAFTADLSETSHRSLLNAGADEIMGKPTSEGVVEATSLRVLRLKNIKSRTIQG